MVIWACTPTLRHLPSTESLWTPRLLLCAAEIGFVSDWTGGVDGRVRMACAWISSGVAAGLLCVAELLGCISHLKLIILEVWTVLLLVVCYPLVGEVSTSAYKFVSSSLLPFSFFICQLSLVIRQLSLPLRPKLSSSRCSLTQVTLSRLHVLLDSLYLIFSD